MSDITPDLKQPTCRVCLQNNKDEEMSSIFDLDADCNNLHIYEKIEQCAGIKIIRHEQIPTLICKYCSAFLKVSYKFRTICRNSNDYLKEYISGLCKKENIEETPPKKNPLLIDNKQKQEDDKSQTCFDNVNDSSSFEVNNVSSEEFNGFANDDLSMNDDHHDEDVNFDSVMQTNEDDGESTDEFKPNKRKRRRSYKKKRLIKKESKRNTPSKTLGISSDGAAIIRDKKTRDAIVKREKKEKQPHICDVCGNIYDRRYTLEVHMRRHRDEKPFECEICNQAFHCNFELTRHIRKHTGSRPFKCSYCSRAFGDRSTLIKHERIHRNERPYKCDTCGKSFTYSNVLKSHILTHTGEKPYNCDLCGKSFTRAHHLRAHLETLQHQNDPRSKILLKQIKKSNEGEQINVNSFIINP
ncbi:hypothetical protein DOY81_007235 [Sarcophaga bullata]|nr:hypothetical protein DOY81_007235 [Sarcophaga bullata]